MILASNELTDRQKEIVELVCLGKSDKWIASELGISIKTVACHRGMAGRKLGLQSFTPIQILIAAARQGVFDIKKIMAVTCLFLTIPALGNPEILSPRQSEIKRSLGKAMIIGPVLRTNTLLVEWDAIIDSSVTRVNVYEGTNENNLNLFVSVPSFVTNYVAQFVYPKGHRPERWFFQLTSISESGEESDFSEMAHWPAYSQILSGYLLTWSASNSLSIEKSYDLFQWSTLIDVPFTNNYSGWYFVDRDKFGTQQFFRLASSNGVPVKIEIAPVYVSDPRDL